MRKKYMEARIVEIERRLKILECPHATVRFVRNQPYGGGYTECEQCGKFLRSYTTEDFLVTKLAEGKERCSAYTDPIKRELKEVRARKKAK